jgi:hypothetical protein
MFKSDNTLKILIGKDLARTASIQITDPATPATYIKDGEILILNENHAPLPAGDDVADSQKITIVQGRGGVNGLKFSNEIDGRNLISVKALSYRAGVEQVTHIGNVGAGADAIDVQPFQDYKLTITYIHDTDLYAQQSSNRVFYYTTNASDTQLSIATAFANMINAEDFYNATATVVNTGVNYGIELLGQPLEFEVGLQKFNKMMFEIQLSGFGTTPVTYTTPADLGSGEGEQVAELEWFANGFDGVINRVHFPAPTGTQDADLSASYDVIALEYFDTSEDYAVSGVKPARALLYVVLPENASQATDFLAQLNPWIASTVRQFNAVTV